MRLAFLWQGFDGRYGQWHDGLWAAMQLISKEHDVRYFDFPLESIHEFNPDIVLYWEAPSTLKGQHADNYRSVIDLPYKKALLFAGGPVEPMTCYGFDLYFVESRINEEEFERLGLPWKRAFGTNTQVFKPERTVKTHKGFLQATFAGWKRQDLFAEALGQDGVVAGRTQEHDRDGYNACVKYGVKILPEQPVEVVARLINQSKAVVNTAAYWGGGQRCTLEAMACGVPVIVMADSPKNREYVDESGAGIVVEPNARDIQKAFEELTPEMGKRGVEYVKSKWTERSYADAILEGIYEIQG